MSTAATETQTSTGLDQPFEKAGSGKNHAAAKTLPARMGKVWAAVTVTGKEYAARGWAVWATWRDVGSEWLLAPVYTLC